MNEDRYQKLKMLLSGFHCCLCCDNGEWRIVEMSESDAPWSRGAGMWWPNQPMLARSVDLEEAIDIAHQAAEDRGWK